MPRRRRCAERILQCLQLREMARELVALRFTGDEREIDIEHPAAGAHEPEFVEWRWEPLQNLPDLVVPFKREIYERVVAEFSKFA